MLSVYLLEYINSYTYSQRYLNNFNEYNYVHFTPKKEFNPENGLIDSFKREKLDGEIFSSDIYLFNGLVVPSYKDVILYVYNDEFYNLMYEECLTTNLDDALPVVVKSNMGYKVGDVIEYLYKDTNETKKLKLYVYDVVDDFYFNYGKGGSKLSASNIFEDVDLTNDNFFIINNKYLNLNKKINNFELIFFNNNKELFEDNIQYLKNNGFVNTKNDILNNTKEEIMESINIMLPYILIVLIISLTTLISLCYLNVYSNKKMLSVLYIIGFPKNKKKQFVLSYIIYILFIIMIIVSFGIFLMVKLSNLLLSFYSILLIIIYLLLFSFITGIIMYRFLVRNNINYLNMCE